MNLATTNCYSNEVLDPHELCILTTKGAEYRQTGGWENKKIILRLKGLLDLTSEFRLALLKQKHSLGEIDYWKLEQRGDRFFLCCVWDWGLTHPERLFKLEHLPKEWRHLVWYQSEAEKLKYLTGS